MKIRHILINILPLPLWVIYYLATISKKELFMMPIDDNAYFIIIIAFTIYNLFSKSVFEFLARNLSSILSITIGCLISGQLYLKLCYHMSDEHYEVQVIPFGIALGALVITGIACVIGFIIIRKKSNN